MSVSSSCSSVVESADPAFTLFLSGTWATTAAAQRPAQLRRSWMLRRRRMHARATRAPALLRHNRCCTAACRRSLSAGGMRNRQPVRSDRPLPTPACVALSVRENSRAAKPASGKVPGLLFYACVKLQVSQAMEHGPAHLLRHYAREEDVLDVEEGRRKCLGEEGPHRVARHHVAAAVNVRRQPVRLVHGEWHVPLGPGSSDSLPTLRDVAGQEGPGVGPSEA